MKNGLKLKDILQWMLDNKDDYDAMDEINRTSYAYMGKRVKEW